MKRGLPYLMLALTALALVASLKSRRHTDRQAVFRYQPRGIMGTDCQIVAIAGSAPQRARLAARAAEAALRDVEAKMSTWIASSELSRFNRAKVGRTALSGATLDVLRAAKALHSQTAGAFDVTCRPLIELWRAAQKSRSLPTAAAIDDARRQSQWSQIALGRDTVHKAAASTRVDLGGIAKGYAIDRAIEAMRRPGIGGGLVEVGGDLRVFGKPPSGTRWAVHVRDPFERGRTLATLAVERGAVCTSGNYARYVEIGGKRYSHIIDPRRGWPTDAVPSVTVIAADALTADGWATALSVLGEKGLARLPNGVDAMLVIVDGAKRPKAIATTGFVAKLAVRPQLPMRIARGAPR